eukprot:Protomagalhaensia_sp_Gyna_25__2670@NODE_2525_length_1035_cov_2407_054217_g2093_i0_p1_GENE_NODE_2525_length_1035_cov_2407_054217_g2093_i0NODE_2525_length_1035_cov_2407_054217_g2093_i0_p1_ORF_typecomplete_len241_score42_69SdpI/PF13630_6/0_19SdpI/PF13630_6/2e03YfhO/PF09586_10/0_071DUF1624/PF07786_12/0_18MFS_3/PF05977_13/9_7MFS_3/PF05977_13/1Serinc/PF03348_15/0_34DUF3093/PF11292_8/0_95DUF3093/PF11292_8/6_7e02YtpI/PF14007_6/0_24YtpI/PF14007_6/2_4e03DUF3784/PF12650_7/0_44DUF3784/PF12650_7/8_9e03DUF348
MITRVTEMYSRRGKAAAKTPGRKSMVCGGVLMLALGGLRFAMEFNWWWLVILVLLGLLSIIFYATAKLPKACIACVCVGVAIYQVYDRVSAFVRFGGYHFYHDWYDEWFDDEEEIGYGVLGGAIAAAALAAMLYSTTLVRLFKASQEPIEEDAPVTVVQMPHNDVPTPAPANVTVAVNNYAGYPGAVSPPPPPPPVPAYPPPAPAYPPPPGPPPVYDAYGHYPPNPPHDQWGHPVYPPRH